MKAAVYCGTRNVYEEMIPSMKSLLIHSDVDKIYFLIEDDEFPYELPSEVTCINVSQQTWFNKGGPNYNSPWSYIILLRAAYSKIFPQLDKIISFDNDTIINENISDLWDINIDNYYFAGVKEPKKSTPKNIYINSGVLIYNLKKIREDKMDDMLIEDLNTYYRMFPEQESFSDLCSGKVLELSPDYNINNYTHGAKKKKILHFAASQKKWKDLPIVQKYRDAEIIRNMPKKYTLDIIIPYYNNPEGLQLTLNSVYYPELENINITVVDDCSTQDYDFIKEQYPKVNFLRLETNSGPGLARQYGINNTSNSHILFIDTGDYILSKFNLIEILDTINTNTIPYLYLWRWLNAEHGTYSSDWNPLLHGWVIKRELLELYNITFSAEGSRSNEDSGFMRPCQIIVDNLQLTNKYSYKMFSETPILMYTYNPNSMVHANNQLYMYKDHIRGLTINAAHIETTLVINRVNPILIAQEITRLMVNVYMDFLRCAKNKPEYLKNNWEYIKNFYEKTYKKYEKVNQNFLQQIYARNLNAMAAMKSRIISNVNLKLFINELKNNKTCPQKYIL